MEERLVWMKTFAVVGAFVAACCALPFGACAANPMHVQARSAMLVDLKDGHVLYEQDADTPIPPASLTKVLTLYLVHEAVEAGRLRPEEMVTVSRRAAARGGSQMGLRAGEEVPVSELIKGMAVASGNDACVAIAEHLCGSVEQFVRLMNRKAAELGMRGTVFRTADGLPAEGQFTTARDMAKLAAAYLSRFPYALGIHSMQTYTYRRSTHRNANRLLGTCPGVDGLKTGFVCASGYNFIATANRGGHRLVAVVLGARSPGVRAAETAKLINQGYASLNIETPPLYAAAKALPDQSSRAKPKPAGPPKVSWKKPVEKTAKRAVAPAGQKTVSVSSKAAAKGAVPAAAGKTVKRTDSEKRKTATKTARHVPEKKVQAKKTSISKEAPSWKKKPAVAKVQKTKSQEKPKVISPPAARKTTASHRPS